MQLMGTDRSDFYLSRSLFSVTFKIMEENILRGMALI